MTAHTSRSSPRRSKSRSKSPRHSRPSKVLKRRLSGKARRAAVTRRSSKRRTYSGTNGERSYGAGRFVRGDTPDDKLPMLTYEFTKASNTTHNTPDFFFSVYSEGERRFDIIVTIRARSGVHPLSWSYSGVVQEYDDEGRLDKYALALRSQQYSLLSTLSFDINAHLSSGTIVADFGGRTYTFTDDRTYTQTDNTGITQG